MPVYRSFSVALSHFSPTEERSVARFRVQDPPQERDFRAVGRFDKGEVAMYAVRRDQWMGAFGNCDGVRLDNVPRNVHSHIPRDAEEQALPQIAMLSKKDTEVLYWGMPMTTVSPFGMVRVRIPDGSYGTSFNKTWFHAEATLLGNNGRAETIGVEIPVNDGEGAQILMLHLLTDLRTRFPAVGETTSFYVRDFPVRTRRGGFIRGEIAFVVWRHFRELFERFDNDPFKLLKPTLSWRRLFIEQPDSPR